MAGSTADVGKIDKKQQLRRAPSQERSREKVKSILEAASALIAQSGSDALRMTEVAQRAGMSIGALYQYFPDKSAIVRVLAENCNMEARQCIEEALNQLTHIGQLGGAMCELLEQYYAMFKAEPVMRDIWSATQADKALRDIEIEESRRNGRLLADTILRLRPDLTREAVETPAFLVMHLAEATMRLAIGSDGVEGQALVDAYKDMARKTLEAMG